MSASRASTPPASPASPAAHLDQVGGLEVSTICTGSSQVIVQMRGELDLASAPLLAAVLEHQLRLGHRFARLDVSRLYFCDCGGLRAIVAGHNAFLAAGGTLSLTGLTRPVRRLLAITGLDEALVLIDPPPNASWQPTVVSPR